MIEAAKNVRLVQATLNDAELIHKMQVESFMSLFLKYQDEKTNPVNESLDIHNS